MGITLVSCAETTAFSGRSLLGLLLHWNLFHLLAGGILQESAASAVSKLQGPGPVLPEQQETLHSVLDKGRVLMWNVKLGSKFVSLCLGLLDFCMHSFTCCILEYWRSPVLGTSFTRNPICMHSATILYWLEFIQWGSEPQEHKLEQFEWNQCMCGIDWLLAYYAIYMDSTYLLWILNRVEQGLNASNAFDPSTFI